METSIQPIFLFADSQLLFWSDGDDLFLDRARRRIENEAPRAAYVGASNGDRPEFYALFEGAMQGIGIPDCRMIPAEPTDEDLDFFDQADLILLAGGDVERGWRAFESNGLQQRVVERYYAGALLIGISAGAIQLGLSGLRETEPTTNGAPQEPERFDTFKLIPLVIDAHQEPDWLELSEALPQAGELIQGLGIPSGGGAIVHPDMTVEPVRHALVELSLKGKEVRQNLILPPDEETEPPPAEDAETPPVGAEN